MESFTPKQAARLLGTSARRLAHWEKIGFISRSITNEKGKFYSFQDLVSLKAANELLIKGISLQQVTGSLENIRRQFPEIKNLSELKFIVNRNALIMRYNGTSFDPLSGQIVMDFEEDLPQAPTTFRAPKKEKNDLFWFEYGLRYDVEGKWKLAAKAYRKALKLNPVLPDCWNNLATIYYRVGKKKKAVRYYLNALKLNPSYKLAYYNLGNILEEIDRNRMAIKMYLKAIELDPSYFDAHYNLALVYDKVHSFAEACHHWELYLKQDSSSRWARYARERIQQIATMLIYKGKKRDEVEK